MKQNYFLLILASLFFCSPTYESLANDVSIASPSFSLHADTLIRGSLSCDSLAIAGHSLLVSRDTILKIQGVFSLEDFSGHPTRQRRASLAGEKILLRVKKDGLLQVGSLADSIFGELRVAKNTALYVEAGAVVRIAPGSQVIIEPGGELQLAADATVEDYTARPIIYESVFSSHNRPLTVNPIFDSTLAVCIPQGFPIRIGPSSERLYCRDWVDYMGIPHSILLSLKLKARDISKKKFDGFYNYYTTYLPVILNNNILYTEEEKLKNLITIRFPDYGTIYRIDAKTAYAKFGINCMHGALIIDSLPQFEQRKIKAVFEKDLSYPTYRGREKNFPQKGNPNREKSSNFK